MTLFPSTISTQSLSIEFVTMVRKKTIKTAVTQGLRAWTSLWLDKGGEGVPERDPSPTMA